ncbi:MAG: hypothetical protein IID40_12205, partial [Planctomycetes bacterium]|nr:hypothetical protein [Planctomycetota bacterium]
MRSKIFDVEYRVNPAALPLEAVRLWYTVDRGASWSSYGLDNDRQSPVAFHAPQEGLFGFYIVVENASGTSSAEPQPRSVPHLWAYIDYTPPVVQVHRPQFRVPRPNYLTAVTKDGVWLQFANTIDHLCFAQMQAL